MSDEPRHLRRGELYEIIGSHPGVTRKLKKPVACTGFMATGFSFKKRREGRLPTCKNPAYWTFRPLRWRLGGLSARRPIEHFCWSHLIHRGVWGGMKEEARTLRWLHQLGYTVTLTYESVEDEGK